MKAPHVLIVDDDPNTVMPIEFLMRKNGYRVGIARNGTEALAAIAETRYDLMLLDVLMPGVDGRQLCQQLRHHPAQAQAKVICFSAKSHDADVQKGYDVGADLYVARPFSTRQLMEQVRELLGSAR